MLLDKWVKKKARASAELDTKSQILAQYMSTLQQFKTTTPIPPSQPNTTTSTPASQPQLINTTTPTPASQPQLFNPILTPASQPQLFNPIPTPASQPQLFNPIPTPASQPQLFNPIPTSASQPQLLNPQPQLLDTIPTPASQPQLFDTPATNPIFSDEFNTPAPHFDVNQFGKIAATPTSATHFTNYPYNFLNYHHCAGSSSHFEGLPLQSSTPRATSPSYSDYSGSGGYQHMV